jgi:hypothetical protein
MEGGLAAWPTTPQARGTGKDARGGWRLMDSLGTLLNWDGAGKRAVKHASQNAFGEILKTARRVGLHGNALYRQAARGTGSLR